MEIVIASSFLKTQKYYEKKYEWNLVNNFIALFHASTCFILGCLYFLYVKDENIKYLLIKNSTGYFLYDFYVLIENKKINLLTLFYLYHHIVSIYFINLQELINILVLFLAELSNIPSYFTYYCLKKNHRYLKICKYIQFLVYFFIRIIIATYIFLYLIFNNINNKLSYLPILPLYLVGFIWSRSLYLKL